MRSLSGWLPWFAGFGLILPFALAVPQGQAVPQSPPQTSAPSGVPGFSQSTLDQLNSMFSTEIQTTVAACWEQGKVDLEAGASPQGWIACRDGSVVPGITRTSYVSTVADLMAASTLIGLRAAISTDPRLTPQILSTFIGTDQGNQLLQDVVQVAIAQSGLQPADNPASLATLTDAVVLRLTDNLSNPNRLDSLLGTPDQYTQTVAQFCSAPGMAIADAQQQIGLDSVQLFAVCIEESGAAREAFQQIR